ncbi:hypothetical protein C471_02525 [Halorubrum saccharovorum DSM 1137]|uniref:Uncharacterized protein n=1 Tax=Halorubrum saccharovorum DSM 1137 TaxID=1227484 RepID=M0E4X0_9EURY|nr:hypothetical protein [Halorubrum saccharovorum]ELZ42831.1 hypothetical protein C471_02525 [Halorubrum saccharovorum DSM 1137]
MSDDVTVDVEVEVEVDSDELRIERDDAEVIEATYEANGVEIEVEAEVEVEAESDAEDHGDETGDYDGESVDGDGAESVSDDGGYEGDE